MKTQAVIGAQFGDEGKGLFTAFLCSQAYNPIVARFSGGHQAGHGVVHNGIRHIFSSFGSGTLQKIPSYWSADCTFYPIAFMNEFDILLEKVVHPQIHIHKKCPVTTFYDVASNQMSDLNKEHGSCGVGFGATLQREEDGYSLLVEDLFNKTVLDIKLQMICNYYFPKNFVATEHFDESYKRFMEACDQLRAIFDNGYVFITDKEAYEMPYYDTLIYEGSQGMLLDQFAGFFPHVTRSTVGSRFLGLDPKSDDEVFYVTRAYQTRHGNGPMTNENIKRNIKIDPDETNQLHDYQGEFRRAILDLDLLKYSLMKDGWKGKKSLVITCLDHVENEWQYTIGAAIFTFVREEKFITAIRDALGFNEVYVSRSPDYTQITQYS